MSVITNKDIIEFYSRKVIENEEVFQKTYYFEKEHRQRSGGYISLARTFLSGGMIGEDDNDKRFYEWLRAKEDEQTIYQLRALKYLEGDTEFDIFLNYSKLNQKWHCLVSWYAYTEFQGRLNDKTYTEPICEPDTQDSCILKKSIRCPELRVWLLEAAVDGINVTNRDVDQFLKEALFYTEDREKNKSKWENVLAQYNQKIIAAIAASK